MITLEDLTEDLIANVSQTLSQVYRGDILQREYLSKLDELKEEFLKKASQIDEDELNAYSIANYQESVLNRGRKNDS